MQFLLITNSSEKIILKKSPVQQQILSSYKQQTWTEGVQVKCFCKESFVSESVHELLFCF